jgi:glycosyltransferase involved in cell wall biosynthesis
VFQNNISLRSLIPALLMQKRVIVVHQTWLRKVDGGIGWNNRVKRALLRFVTNIAISEAIGDHISVPARIIHNPYDDGVFRLHPEIARDKELVFVGRLVSDKGVDVLLRALEILRTSEANAERPTPKAFASRQPNAQRPMAEEEGIEHHNRLQPDLTIIGVGPEEGKLRELSRELGLDRQVTFAGEKSGNELAAALNRHQIMVVPSRWAEPFGIVALEGISCGCVVVGSRDGGLREAIGPCGLTFKNGDERELADCLKELLLDTEKIKELHENAAAHLAKFRAETIACKYLELMQQVR